MRACVREACQSTGALLHATPTFSAQITLARSTHSPRTCLRARTHRHTPTHTHTHTHTHARTLPYLPKPVAGGLVHRQCDEQEQKDGKTRLGLEVESEVVYKVNLVVSRVIDLMSRVLLIARVYSRGGPACCRLNTGRIGARRLHVGVRSAHAVRIDLYRSKR